MVTGKTFPETLMFQPILLKLLYFISGVMFPLYAIPQRYWHYLLWDPLLHVMELNRMALIPGYISTGVSLTYLAFCFSLCRCTVPVGRRC